MDMVSLQPSFNNPRWVNAVFSTSELSWIWLMARVYIGWHWLEAGWHKMTSDAWMNGGDALAGFWTRAIVVPESGRPAISYDWYREFLKFMLDNGWEVWFGQLVAIGEFAVGLGLIVGALTGIAAFFGAVMNWNFMLAGTASTNPVLGIIAIGIMIAWKTAGWWGIDRFLLPVVGASWKAGTLFGGAKLLSLPDGRAAIKRVSEEWGRMLIGVAVALFALIQLEGWSQVSVLLGAGVIVATTGKGWLFVSPVPTKEQP
jgi:thiosulfate dehydrogenase [quinone] large subunit